MTKRKRASRKHRISPFVVKAPTTNGPGAPAQLFAFNAETCTENMAFSSDQINTIQYRESIAWLNLHSVSDIPFLKEIGNHFKLETLTLDKLIDLDQRPKMEEFEHYLYLSVKTLWVNSEARIETEQISFVLGIGYLLSFQEKEADLFEDVRDRIRRDKGIVRKKRSGYLLYLMLDAITENYIKAFNFLSDKVEELNKAVVEQQDENALPMIELLKQELGVIKRNLNPLRDVVTALHNGESEILLPETVKFIGNIREQITSILEEADRERQILEGLTNIHLTNLNNKMNEVMKVLTVIATIFIPLTFVAGIYGMNFKFMPELEWKYGYLAALALMFLMFVGMLVYFRRKRWF